MRDFGALRCRWELKTNFQYRYRSVINSEMIRVSNSYSYRPQIVPMESGARKLPIRNSGDLILGCHKWGFKRWGFKEIRGYLAKKAFFLRFLDFPGALRALRKRAKEAEKWRFRPISADFQAGRPDTP